MEMLVPALTSCPPGALRGQNPLPARQGKQLLPFPSCRSCRSAPQPFAAHADCGRAILGNVLLFLQGLGAEGVGICVSLWVSAQPGWWHCSSPDPARGRSWGCAGATGTPGWCFAV